MHVVGGGLSDDVPGADRAELGVGPGPAENLFGQEIDQLDHAFPRGDEEPSRQEQVQRLLEGRNSRQAYDIA